MDVVSKPSIKATTVQILCSLCASACMLSPGMNMGYSAFALKYMKIQFHLDEDQETWIASLSNLITPIGCLLSGPILERFGRKFSVILVAVPCTIGWILMAYEPNLFRLYLGRALTGLATGLASTPGSVYSAESATSTIRGYLMSGSTLFISVGILIVNVLGLIFKDNWQIVAWIGAAVSVLIALITLICIPESPVWLISRGEAEKAVKSLKMLRGTNQTEVIQKELDFMLMNRRNDETIRSDEGILSKLMRPEAYKPLIILNVFFLIQQFTGIYVAVAYTLDFVQASGVKTDVGMVAVILGALRLIVIFIGTFTSKTYGRRFTSIVSGVGMTPCLFILAIDRYIHPNTDVPKNNGMLFEALNSSNLVNSSFNGSPITSALSLLVENTMSTMSPIVFNSSVVSSVPSQSGSWIPVVAIIFYMIFSTFGFLIIPWSLLGELFPAKCRGVACGITACVAYLLTFLIIKSYKYMVLMLGTYGIFALYGTVSLIGTIFVIVFLPETQGKSLTEIEHHFSGNILSDSNENRSEEEVSLHGNGKSPTIVSGHKA